MAFWCSLCRLLSGGLYERSRLSRLVDIHTSLQSSTSTIVRASSTSHEAKTATATMTVRRACYCLRKLIFVSYENTTKIVILLELWKPNDPTRLLMSYHHGFILCIPGPRECFKGSLHLYTLIWPIVLFPDVYVRGRQHKNVRAEHFRKHMPIR